METIYLSLRAQVALGTLFIKSPVSKNALLEKEIIEKNIFRDPSWLVKSIYYVFPVCFITVTLFISPNIFLPTSHF